MPQLMVVTGAVAAVPSQYSEPAARLAPQFMIATVTPGKGTATAICPGHCGGSAATGSGTAPAAGPSAAGSVAASDAVKAATGTAALTSGNVAPTTGSAAAVSAGVSVACSASDGTTPGATTPLHMPLPTGTATGIMPQNAGDAGRGTWQPRGPEWMTFGLALLPPPDAAVLSDENARAPPQKLRFPRRLLGEVFSPSFALAVQRSTASSSGPSAGAPAALAPPCVAPALACTSASSTARVVASSWASRGSTCPVPIWRGDVGGVGVSQASGWSS
mmetsp:Transcript_111121/g.310861  ORF Transcript_111121/g.310861 Transcript_111121/m.310861 type:complete len:275 (+) Transcript_111121:735-1559(+)